MILINLLPPELRKRAGGINPIALGLIASAAACVVLAGLWLDITFWVIPAAQQHLAKRQDYLRQVEADAKKVEDLKTKIADITKQRDTVAGLVQSKFYWARTIDELANAVTGQFSTPGFSACCTELAIAPATQAMAGRSGPAAGEVVKATVKAKFKLLGKDENRGGDYVKSFLFTLQGSQFWKRNGFEGKTEDSYKGDSKVWVKDLARVTIELPLDFVRVATITPPKKKGAN